MKLRLLHKLKLLRYKVINIGRRIEQRWTSWKSTREGRVNFKLLNLFVYIYALSVCKICTLQSEKNRRKIVKLRTYSRSIIHPSCMHLYAFGLTLLPLPAHVLYWWPLGLNSLVKKCVKKQNPQIHSTNIMRHESFFLQNKEFYRIYTTIVFQLSMTPHLYQVSTRKQILSCLQKLVFL